MNERGATMVSDQDIAAALESLVREASPNTTLNDVVQQLESKLGLDLTHKVDFIRAQIHFLLRSEPPHLPQPQPPPQQPQPQPQPHHHPSKDKFSLHQNPNYQVAPSELPPNFALHRTDEFGFRPPQPPPVTKTEAFVADVATPAPSAPAAPAEASKEGAQTGKKRRGGPGGLNKLCGVSPQLQAIVGQPALPRTEIVKQLWAYIRKNNLQDPSNKRKIICNDELRLVFETDCTDMFKMNKLLAKHIITLEPTKQVGQSSKKLKVGMESRTESTESGPIVILSEALANFFGTSGREMLQSEAMRHVWEYIKVNQLEDPLNSMVIHCDSKLQELFGCESISVLGISELLLRHHLFNRS